MYNRAKNMNSKKFFTFIAFTAYIISDPQQLTQTYYEFENIIRYAN